MNTNQDVNSNGQEMIRVLEYPENIRMKWGMYIDSPSTMLREAIDNSTDEVLASKECDLIIIDTSIEGYNMVADKGRGIPIFMSPDKPTQTQADVAVSTLHAGSKFVNMDSKVGTFGLGISCTNALSEEFWVLSKITEDNYSKSIPAVKAAWESLGPRQRKEAFYMAGYQRGYKISEGAATKREIEANLFKGKAGLPPGMSTIILFKVDTTIFPNPHTDVPVENLQNFLFIQEKFYRRKLSVIANGEKLSASNIKPYTFEILKTITPADPSENPYLGVYVSFEVDPALSPKSTLGSVNGLVVNAGVHVSYIEKCFEDALREEYKISHKTIFPGLKMRIILLAENLIYDSQIKSRLKSITKVKQTDFSDITKEFGKVFRKNDDYWRAHVDKLNALAESYRSIGAVEKAQKMISGSTGREVYRIKQELSEGFSDATCGPSERMKAELFLCFTGDTKVKTTSGNITFTELVERMSGGETFQTYTYENGVGMARTILAASLIQKSTHLTTIVLEGGEGKFVCTPDHKVLMRDGREIEAKDLRKGDQLMSTGEGIVAVGETIEASEDVYCLEVDSPYHNFLLDCGVFVRNCEGLSPGSSLKSGRKSTKYEAIMPLRGKTLNVADKTDLQMLDNKEFSTIFKAIGLGLDVHNVTVDCQTPEEAWGEICKYSRYGKIVIATD